MSWLARVLRRDRRLHRIERRIAAELDPRPDGCDCGRPASVLIPDDNGHSWRCPCGLTY